ncbi:MAG: PEP-CTERM sorting domain-containing protein [Pseudomonadota bacterium]
MKFKLWLVAAIGFLLLNLSGVAYASIIVDVNAKLILPVEVTLSAGSYVITPFAGTFTAWNAWGVVNGNENDFPAPYASRPPVGWMNSYWIDGVKYFDDMVYYTAEDALANAVTAYITLTEEKIVTFSINDSPVTDNWGGMSLNVAPVPEPATLLLFGVGLLGLAGVNRRKK